MHLVLHQGSPNEIAAMLLDGQADIGIATEALKDAPFLAAFQFYSWHHSIVVPKGHPLASENPLTLEAIAEWPILTYNENFTGRRTIDVTFANAGLVPDIVLSAMDTDVLKTYVELGLGIGIIASMTFDPKRDCQLQLLDGAHLFPDNTSLIAVRKGSYLRNYAYRFIELCSPALPEKVVRSAALSDQAVKSEPSSRRGSASPLRSGEKTLGQDEAKRIG